MLLDFPQRIELVARHRLLENFDAQIGQSFRKSNGVLGIVSLVGVDLDKDIAVTKGLV